eukprot:gene4073-biopygen3913
MHACASPSVCCTAPGCHGGCCSPAAALSSSAGPGAGTSSPGPPSRCTLGEPHMVNEGSSQGMPPLLRTYASHPRTPLDPCPASPAPHPCQWLCAHDCVAGYWASQ